MLCPMSATAECFGRFRLGKQQQLKLKLLQKYNANFDLFSSYLTTLVKSTHYIE